MAISFADGRKRVWHADWLKPGMREKAIAEYHDWLTDDESLTAELFARLKGEMDANRLLFGIVTAGGKH